MKTAKRFAMLAGLALALMVVPSFAGCSKKGETAKAAPESTLNLDFPKTEILLESRSTRAMQRTW